MPRIRRTVPFGSSRAVTDESRRNDRIAAMDVMGWPTSTPPPSPVPPPANTAAGGAVPEEVVSAASDEFLQPAHLGGPLGGVLLLRVVRTAERTSAAVARLAPTGGAVRAATRSATVASSSAAGTTTLASPIACASAAPTARPVRQISIARE